MGRIRDRAVTLSLVATCLASSISSGPTTIELCFYAPMQAHSPVRIVGFDHDQREIQFVLANNSDKAVESVIIAQVVMPPPGCAGRPEYGRLSESGGRFQAFIAPHSSTVLSGGSVHYPRVIVHLAQGWGAPYLPGQFGITGVFFRDGTTWPTPVETHSRNEPFDRQLVEAEGARCSGPDAALALNSIREIVFDRESRQESDRDRDKNLPPHLRFRCSLEGPRAVCRLPMEGDHPSGQSRREQTGPN
jgi:hypothetical protein